MLHFFARRMKEAREDEQGFTLIELLVVVTIIGILAAIAIPTFLAQRSRAQESAAQSDLRNAGAAATTCASANNGSYSNCTKEILISTYDFKATDGVTLTVSAHTTNAWTANAKNDNGGRTFEFSTATGRVAPETAPVGP